jgi:hypothetical protein
VPEKALTGSTIPQIQDFVARNVEPFPAPCAPESGCGLMNPGHAETAEIRFDKIVKGTGDHPHCFTGEIVSISGRIFKDFLKAP